jgi:hypothetical protein
MKITISLALILAFCLIAVTAHSDAGYAFLENVSRAKQNPAVGILIVFGIGLLGFTSAANKKR